MHGRARELSDTFLIDQEMFREAAVRSHVNREVRAELSAFRFSNPFGPWAVQMTEGRGLPAGGTSAPGIGRVVEPPGTAYLPANLPSTPSEWSSNSDDSE